MNHLIKFILLLSTLLVFTTSWARTDKVENYDNNFENSEATRNEEASTEAGYLPLKGLGSPGCNCSNVPKHNRTIHTQYSELKPKEDSNATY